MCWHVVVRSSEGAQALGMRDLLDLHIGMFQGHVYGMSVALATRDASMPVARETG
jgi:hypothetical protein